MRPRFVQISLALALSSLGPASVAVSQQAGRVYVLDTGARALVALELPSGKRVGSLALPGAPAALLQSPDGSRLVVLDAGPGEDKDERGYKATGKSSAVVVDPATLAVVGRVELGSGVAGVRRSYFSPDSRRLASGSRDYTMKVWDTARWNEMAER